MQNGNLVTNVDSAEQHRFCSDWEKKNTSRKFPTLHKSVCTRQNCQHDQKLLYSQGFIAKQVLFTGSCTVRTTCTLKKSLQEFTVCSNRSRTAGHCPQTIQRHWITW